MSNIIIWICGILLAGILLLATMYGLARRNTINVHKVFQSKEDGKQLTIFFISDIHNRYIQDKMLSKVDVKIDVVIIGGDLADKRVSIMKLLENIHRLQRWGSPIYFIPGNNDHELIEASIVDLLYQEGVHVLSNRDVDLSLDGRLSCTLSGMDPYYLVPRRHSSLVKDADNFQILTVHDPMVFQHMNEEDKGRFELILTGHTHGGQIRFLGFGPFTRGGWFEQQGYSLLISEGYGTSLLPLRLGTRAECHVIEILPG